MIDLEKQARIWIIRINRPEKANSLTKGMLEKIGDIVVRATDVHAVILTGCGDVFSAGADLREVKAGLAKSKLWEQISKEITKLECLTIAAINGTIAGGAFGMALACDLRIATPNANFFYPVMKLGFLPQPSDPKRLSNLVGPAKAKLILMGGQVLSADEALAIGLVDRLYKNETLLSKTLDIASHAKNANIGHVKAIKRMFP